MISHLIGTIFQKNKNSLVIMTAGGVGYEIYVCVSTLARMHVGGEVQMYTYLKVSETAMDLYGFETIEEKNFFELLLSVKGVGPKGALNILGLGSIVDIQQAISRADVSYLTQVSGLGKKTAERLCVELKSKVGRLSGGRGLSGEGSSKDVVVLGEVVEGLIAMGYTKDEAREVVTSLDDVGKDTEQLLREALKTLGRT